MPTFQNIIRSMPYKYRTSLRRRVFVAVVHHVFKHFQPFAKIGVSVGQVCVEWMNEERFIVVADNMQLRLVGAELSCPCYFCYVLLNAVCHDSACLNRSVDDIVNMRCFH